MSRRNFEAVVMDTVYAAIHVEYVFIARILIYILHKYWMRNSISPFYDVCNCFIICHLIITRILASELNYRFTNSKTSLAIVIQYSLQEEESRNVSSELVSLINSQMAIEPNALERWWQHTNCSTHCTRDMSQTSSDTSYSIASFIFKVVSKVNFTYFSFIKVNICQTVGVKHILDYK